MVTDSGRRKPIKTTRFLLRVAVLALSGLALAGCVVYPAGPYYGPHYYYDDGGWGHHGWR